MDPLPAEALAAAARAAAVAEEADQEPLDTADYQAGVGDGRRVARAYIDGGHPDTGYDENLFGNTDYHRGLRHGQELEYSRAAVAWAMDRGKLCPTCGATGIVNQHAPGCHLGSE